MERVAVETHRIVVLAAGKSASDGNNQRGHLFEKFVAQLLSMYGYNEPRVDRINVTADGIELDVVASSSFSNSSAVVECKAYASNVSAQACTSFVGKLQLARYENAESDIHGYLFVLPRLVAQGEEVARKIARSDRAFHYLNADRIVERLIEKNVIAPLPADVGDASTSDPAVLITESGIYSCVKVLNYATHRTDYIFVWGRDGRETIPSNVVELLAGDPYASSSTIRVQTPTGGRSALREVEEHVPPVIVTVRGSSSDFEYQFPASPQFFVGRHQFIGEIKQIVERKRGSFVLNAQSGWGKSSLALQAKQIVDGRGGYAAVIDSRTANTPAFVVEALREAAVSAEMAKLLKLPTSSSWASLQSALTTIERATWNRDEPLLVFFDQFENVFQHEATTREFRNLTLLLNELHKNVIVGYAWKTDLVTLTESHPYRLRDEIRSNSAHISLGPMGSRDVEALLRRLEKVLQEKVSPDLRQRAREYSQGLPWLFKKLANHILSEISNGKTQEVLVSEGLNVQSLFDSDLAGLTPVENEAIRHIARFAPVTATEVTEKYDGEIIQSLLNARLVVAVGDKLDTYWDIFRDFLNTGRVPIEDSYIVRQNPPSVARLLIAVVEFGGDTSVQDLCILLNASATMIYNLSRELRLFGLTAYESNRVRLQDDVISSPSPEAVIRLRVARALRRHRAYSLFLALTERLGEAVLLSTYARELPSIFPAVDAQEKTWLMYARAFALWFNYSGLALMRGNNVCLPPEGFVGVGNLLSSEQASRRRTAYSLNLPATACLRTLVALDESSQRRENLRPGERRHLGPLASLGLISIDGDGVCSSVKGAVVDGVPSVEFLHMRLIEYPGAREGIQLLENDPSVENLNLGLAIKAAVGAPWQESTADDIGGDFRSWAKAAGINVAIARRRRRIK